MSTAKFKNKRFLLGLALVMFIVFITVCVVANTGPKETGLGHFKDQQGEKAYYQAYDEVMASMPQPTATYDIKTFWGNVRVYEWRHTNSGEKVPVVLLPGHSSGAPMWHKNIPLLAAERTVFALDALGDAGKSQQTLPLTSNNDVSDWISETLTGLKIKQVHIVGHSFGGGYAANFAVRHPEQVQTLTLLEPAFALNMPPASTLFWATVSSLKFLPESWRNVGLAKISGEAAADVASNDPLANMIKYASAYYASSLPTPRTLSTSELGSINLPIYVALANQSAITGKQAEKNAKMISNAEVKVWPDTTHSLPMEVAEALAIELESFWTRNE